MENPERPALPVHQVVRALSALPEQPVFRALAVITADLVLADAKEALDLRVDLALAAGTVREVLQAFKVTSALLVFQAQPVGRVAVVSLDQPVSPEKLERLGLPG